MLDRKKDDKREICMISICLIDLNYKVKKRNHCSERDLYQDETTKANLICAFVRGYHFDYVLKKNVLVKLLTITVLKVIVEDWRAFLCLLCSCCG